MKTGDPNACLPAHSTADGADTAICLTFAWRRDATVPTSTTTCLVDSPVTTMRAFPDVCGVETVLLTITCHMTPLQERKKATLTTTSSADPTTASATTTASRPFKRRNKSKERRTRSKSPSSTKARLPTESELVSDDKKQK